MSAPPDEQSVCGAENPDVPGMFCERRLCVEYHRNGHVTWDSSQHMPARQPDVVTHMNVVRRTRAKARRTDPVTSHEAAASVGDLTNAQQMILDALRHGPGTDEEIYERLPHFAKRSRKPIISVSGARTRRRELVDAGLVEDSGQRKLTEAGRKTIVWRVIDVQS